MLITNHFTSSSNGKLHGVTFDTENKEYKIFTLNIEDWGNITTNYYIPKENFKIVGDILYEMPKKSELLKRIEELKKLNFKENKDMVLDFGSIII